MNRRGNLKRMKAGRWAMVGLAAVVGLAGTAGCKHRRSAMRPVFLDPAPTRIIEPGCDSPPCEPALMPSETVVPGRSTVTQSEPAFREDFGGSGGVRVIEEGAPSTSPPGLPEPAGEPELEPAPKDDQAVPSNVEINRSKPVDGPDITPPQAYRRGRMAIPTRMTTRDSSVQVMVQERADDPIDLVQPPGSEKNWKFVVFHHSETTAGGYAKLDRVHREKAGLDGCGYHFIIGNGTDTADGAIEVTRRWSDQKSSQHCKDAAHPAINDEGISICLIGNLDQGKPTAKQLESARLLVNYLQTKYQIPTTRVGTHAEVASGGQGGCPGKNLPRESIIPTPVLTRR
jgi:hypothetical protein